jgi:hypothetical protein
MKRLLFGTVLALGLGSVAYAATETRDVREIPPFEQVKSISAFGGLHDFDVLDDRTLILWTTRSQPYLVELMFPSHDLRFAHAIAVESSTNRIHAKFDSVRVAGFRYPIDGIYKLTRDEAKQLKQAS